MMIWMVLMTAEPAREGLRTLEELTRCRAIAADAARLACYDRAAGAITDARRNRDIVVLDRAEVQKAKRSLFGFSLPSIKLFGDGDDDGQLRQVVGTLRSSVPLPGGLMHFVLDDGGAWDTTEQTMMAPRVGDRVTIKAGTLGSYVATAPGRRSVRVHRVH